MESPSQPSVSAWKFVEDLKEPLHKTTIHWDRQVPKKSEADLSGGVSLQCRFPDPHGALETAHRDFSAFLKVEQIGEGPYRIATVQAPTGCFEAYRLDVAADGCRLTANDTEGIRRGLVFLEDAMLRTGGRFLPLGCHERKPLIRTRISRCFFGPIKRPPMNRDELADDVDYYPDEYLNRLAHEGINGLWLTFSFKDLCPSNLFPGRGRDSERRLNKLCQTVVRCGRYGIKIYAFCIEPEAFGNGPEDLAILARHPELAGHKREKFIYFCTSTPKGRQYLEDCMFALFARVPGLGGLIDINLGERATHCYSNTNQFFNNNCPRCSKREPWEVFADTTSALARGLQKANPGAEMISWLYVPYLGDTRGEIESQMDVIRAVAAHVPKNVILQYNFESNGVAEQLGKERVVLDYFLSWPGPARIFSDCALSAVQASARVSAKIQVGCSHEVATAPFLPVPGNLYRKYRSMHELGVSAVMQCWYFGNYPGLMNKAAGELAFAPFPADEADFLLKLAQVDWGRHAAEVVKAWQLFRDGYGNFPINLSFTWYGPVHHAVVWPLYLFPVDQPIAPSWTFTFPLESGDRIGECLCYAHTLDEALILLERMAGTWREGVRIFEGIEGDYRDNPERRLDIGLAKALGLQFQSAFNVFKFYAQRENLPFAGKKAQSDMLVGMETLVREEIQNSLALEALCLKDSRLGFHSEAEGYKYFPAKLAWRAGLLEKLLATDFPAVRKSIENGAPLFPEYTGTKPEGRVYHCPKDNASAVWEAIGDGQSAWRAWRDGQIMHFEVKAAGNGGAEDSATIEIEPRRLWPTWKFALSGSGKKTNRNFKPEQDTTWRAERRGNLFCFAISLACFDGYYRAGGPVRINVTCNESAWINKKPWPSRLRFGGDNPADLGWMLFAP